MFVASWKLAFVSKRRRRDPFASHVSQCRRMGYAPPFTYRTTHRGSGGHHGEGSDAQQQREEEAEAGQKQEERRRSLTVRRHAQPSQTRHLIHEPIRQEALAGDHRARHQRELAPGVHDFIRVGPIPPTNGRFGSVTDIAAHMMSALPPKADIVQHVLNGQVLSCCAINSLTTSRALSVCGLGSATHSCTLFSNRW